MSPADFETVIFLAAVITVAIVTFAAYRKWDKPPKKGEK